jgi:uncharacterized protein (DUF169 family)
MNTIHINEMLKNTLGLKKEIIGLKVWKQEPQGIRKYEGKAFPGICTQIGEVLATGETFITDQENHLCTGGVLGTGVAQPLSRDEKIKNMEMHLEIIRDHADLETSIRYNDSVESLIPPVKEKNAFVQIARFTDLNDPDLVLIFCTPHGADILTRAYTYVISEPIQGFAGNGCCTFIIQYPFVTRKPAFSYSDLSWRKFVGLDEDELTITFPYRTLLNFIDSLPLKAEDYRTLYKAVE